MNHEEILKRLKKCVDTALEHEPESFFLDSSLTDDLKMESVHIVTLQVEIEDEFEIEFDPLEDDFYEIFQTVGTVYHTIEKKLTV